jgi:uridylate kinase
MNKKNIRKTGRQKSGSSKTFVISLGGSLIAPPGGIDVEFLRGFRKLILEMIGKGFRFLIITGGGMTAREYMRAAGKIAKIKTIDADWIGIEATQINAALLKAIFAPAAHPEVIIDPRAPKINGKLIIGAGYQPGNSSDYVAVMLARRYGFEKIANLSNVDYVYDKDPRKFKDAEKKEKISWPDFQKIVGRKWTPGLNAPFDPIAAKLAGRLKLEVAILNGRNLSNLRDYLSGRKFKGTVIK